MSSKLVSCLSRSLVGFLLLIISNSADANQLSSIEIRSLCGAASGLQIDGSEAEISVDGDSFRVKNARENLEIYRGDDLLTKLEGFNYDSYVDCVDRLRRTEVSLPPSPEEQFFGGVKVQLENCDYQSGSVTCAMWVTSDGAKLKIRGETALISGDGSRIDNPIIRVGGVDYQRSTSARWRDHDIEIIPSIKTRMYLVFSRVPASFDRAALYLSSIKSNTVFHF